MRTSPMWRNRSISERIHARAAVTGARMGLMPLRAAVHSWQRLTWNVIAGPQSLRDLSPRWAEKYEEFTGTSPAEQDRVLTDLVEHCGISPADAYWLDLVRDSAVVTWPHYVYSSEPRWNVAASEVLLGSRLEALASAQLLQDKRATAAILRRVGISTPPTKTLPKGAPVSAPDVAAWLGEWPGLFCKPRMGGAGRGALAISVVAGQVTANGQPSSLTDLAHDLQRRLASEAYLVQPLLRNAYGEGMRDVVTLRVVTRWSGDRSPQLFCALLEWPNRFGDSGHEIFSLAPDGRVVAPAMPLWIPGFDVAASKPPVAQVDGFAQITAAALAAHVAIGRIYAVGWDVALTDAGPSFLEGNSGFGTRLPQVAAGGLLPVD